MRSAAFFVFLAAGLSFTAGCDDHHEDGHVHPPVRRSAPRLTPPSRPLQWGDINIIHTTDTHGWLLGHQKPSFPEPNYSGTLGDFASFVTHMKELAEVCLAFSCLLDEPHPFVRRRTLTFYSSTRVIFMMVHSFQRIISAANLLITRF